MQKFFQGKLHVRKGGLLVQTYCSKKQNHQSEFLQKMPQGTQKIMILIGGGSIKGKMGEKSHTKVRRAIRKSRKEEQNLTILGINVDGIRSKLARNKMKN